jgi:hypothetical protein
VDTGVRSSGTLDPDPPATGRETSESAFQLSLHCPLPGLDLEAGKVSAVVFDPRAVTSGDALSGALCCAAPGDGRGLQTSSSWTMGAASPARGPILVMRV